jgi:hypothetical protein
VDLHEAANCHRTSFQRSAERQMTRAVGAERVRRSQARNSYRYRGGTGQGRIR